MTTLTLTIGGNNFLPQYKTGSAVITQQLYNQGGTCTMVIIKKSLDSAPIVGNELIFKDGSRFLFGGFITKVTPTEYGIGNMIEYHVEASDYTQLLVNKYAQTSYANATLQTIVNDIVSKGIASSYGLNTTNVAVGPTITTVAFNHISLRQCFENLAKLTGYIWWVGYDKSIYFVDPNKSTLAPETLTDSVKNHERITISIDSTQVRNDITVLGGKQESQNYTQTIKGDGTARQWLLVYPVTTLVSVKLNGVVKTVGIEGVDPEANSYSMYDASRGSIRLSAASTVLSTSDILEVIFTYPIPVSIEVQGPAEIAAMKALEGGDGIHGYTITDSTILSKDQARQRALKEIANYGSPTLSGEFVTRTGLLQTGSYFTPGQILNVTLPSWNINTATNYTIQRVITTLVETGSTIEYTYTVTFGGRLLGLVDFLQALATPETSVDTTGDVLQIHTLSEVMTFVEVISVKAKDTPPYKYGPLIYEIPLTIDHTKVGGSVVKTNYVIYLDLSKLPNSFFSNVVSDGSTIAVYKSDDTTICPMTLMNINTTAKTGELYFTGDISPTVDTVFYLHHNLI